MAFDANNYVQTNPNGTYTAVVNGKPVADTAGNTSFKDLNFTQQAFNANYHPNTSAPTPSNPTPAGTPSSSGGSSADTTDYSYGNPYGVGATYYDGAWHMPAAGSRPSAFGPTNFVGKTGDQYVAYGGGKQLGTYPTAEAAQQAYNTYFGFSNGQPPATGAGQGLVTGLANGAAAGATGGSMDPNAVLTTRNGLYTRGDILDKLQSAGVGAQQLANAQGLPNDQLVNYYNGVSWQAEQDAVAKQSQDQQAAETQRTHALDQTGFVQNLVDQLKGPNGALAIAPGSIPILNAALSALGLPGYPTSAALGAQGIIPNSITPAEWDSMGYGPGSTQLSPAQQMILLAWEARGGDPNDFLRGIDAQRPRGNPPQGGPSGTVKFAPLAA